MLKKENRLKSRIAFDVTYKIKNIFSDDFIILYVGRKKLDNNCPTRVGFVVSKKIHKRAVKRNRIKRLIRENIRLILKENPDSIINEFQSLIFVAKNSILDKNFIEIKNSVEKLLFKLANKNI